MTGCLFLWYEDGPCGARSHRWEILPECPAVGSTVYVPIGPVNYRGESNLETAKAMTVERVAWTCDGTPYWHAEIRLR
jgi:hypothetical protein